jgi:hypothetical protein
MAQAQKPAAAAAPARAAQPAAAAAKPAPAATSAPASAANAQAGVTSAPGKASPAVGVEPGPLATGATKQGNKVILANGEERTAYIRRRFGSPDENVSRGVIAKELGVAYQIVFAATRGWTQGGGTGQKVQPASVAQGGAQPAAAEGEAAQ